MMSLTPEHLSGSELETAVGYRADKMRGLKIADIRRSGVHAIRTSTGWEVIPSRPDFEGPTIKGPIEFDCKVCSQSSFSLDKYRGIQRTERRRQLTHMYQRAEYGVSCFFLIHWNARDLATKSEQAITYAFPIHPDFDFWKHFEEGSVKSIKRQDCREYGTAVPWSTFGELGRTPSPDILSVL